MLRPFSGPRYRQNVDRAVDKGYEEGLCCMHCGKLSRTAKLAAYTKFGGEYVKPPETTEEIEQAEFEAHIGYFPVGSECAAKLRKAGIHVVPRPEFV